MINMVFDGVQQQSIPAVSLDFRLDGVLLHSSYPCVTFAFGLIEPGLIKREIIYAVVMHMLERWDSLASSPA